MTLTIKYNHTARNAEESVDAPCNVPRTVISGRKGFASADTFKDTIVVKREHHFVFK